jgi:hypothetical protein
MARRRKLTPEFKAQVVLEELTGVKDKAEICLRSASVGGFAGSRGLNLAPGRSRRGLISAAVQ